MRLFCVYGCDPNGRQRACHDPCHGALRYRDHLVARRPHRHCQQRARQERQRLAANLSQDFKGKTLQGITHENGGGFIVGFVNRRSAATQIVIIHGWQIVMDRV